MSICRTSALASSLVECLVVPSEEKEPFLGHGFLFEESHNSLAF